MSPAPLGACVVGLKAIALLAAVAVQAEELPLVPAIVTSVHVSGGARVEAFDCPDERDRWFGVEVEAGVVHVVAYTLDERRSVALLADARDPSRLRRVVVGRKNLEPCSAGLGALWLPGAVGKWDGARHFARVDSASGAVTEIDAPGRLTEQRLAAGLGALWVLGRDAGQAAGLLAIDATTGRVESRTFGRRRDLAWAELALGPDAAWLHERSSRRLVRVDPARPDAPVERGYPASDSQGSRCSPRRRTLAVTRDTAWVVRCGDGALLGLDVRTGELRGPLPLGFAAVEVLADESHVVVRGGEGGRIALIDPVAGTVRAETLLPVAAAPADLEDGVLWTIGERRLWRVDFRSAGQAQPPPVALDSPPVAGATHRAVLEGLASVSSHGAVASGGVAVECWRATGEAPPLQLVTVARAAAWLTTGPQRGFHGTDLYRIDVSRGLEVRRLELPSGPWDLLAVGDGFAWGMPSGDPIWRPSRSARFDTGTGRRTRELGGLNEAFDAELAFGSLWTTRSWKPGIERRDATTGELQALVGTWDGTRGDLVATERGVYALTADEQVLWRVDPGTNVAESWGRLDEAQVVAEAVLAPRLAAAGGALWAVRHRDGALTRVDEKERASRAVELDGGVWSVHGAGDLLLVMTKDRRRLVRLDPASGLALESVELPASSPRVVIEGGVAWASTVTEGDGFRLWRLTFPSSAAGRSD